MAFFAPEPLAQHDEFMLHYGRALAAWSGVEVALQVWFYALTGMEPKMSSAVFYSARSFTGRADLLNAVIGQSDYDADDIALLKQLSKRASTYSAQRNVLAHGHPVYTGDEYDVTLAQGGAAMVPSVTVDMLKIAARNFRNLGACTFGLALNHPRVAQLPFPTPGMRRQECRESLLRLPTSAFSSEAAPPRMERKLRRKPSPA